MGPTVNHSVGFCDTILSGEKSFFFSTKSTQGESRDMQLGANGFQDSKIGAVLSFLVSVRGGLRKLEKRTWNTIQTYLTCIHHQWMWLFSDNSYLKRFASKSFVSWVPRLAILYHWISIYFSLRYHLCVYVVRVRTSPLCNYPWGRIDGSMMKFEKGHLRSPFDTLSGRVLPPSFAPRWECVGTRRPANGNAAAKSRSSTLGAAQQVAES